MVKMPNVPVFQAQVAPFTLEQLQTDICTIFLLEARRHNHLIDPTSGLKSIGLTDEDPLDLLDFSREASDFELTFDLVKDSQFAAAMQDHYDFGFHAITGTRSEPMDYESLHTWFAAYLMDLSVSAYVDEITSYAYCELPHAIKRCLHTIQLSNARCILEGQEPFSYFHRGGSKDDDSASEGELTIPQLAMLAGIEEMSLRSLISRKTAPVLEIRKQDRRTTIDSAVAKEWLKAKGRYQSVRIGRRTADLDLSKAQFRDLGDLLSSLRDRLGVLCDRDQAAKEALESRLQRHDKNALSELSGQDFTNEMLMNDIAEALELPAHWLVYRAQEALLKQEIAARQIELDLLKFRSPASKSNPQ